MEALDKGGVKVRGRRDYKKVGEFKRYKLASYAQKDFRAG